MKEVSKKRDWRKLNSTVDLVCCSANRPGKQSIRTKKENKGRVPQSIPRPEELVRRELYLYTERNSVLYFYQLSRGESSSYAKKNKRKMSNLA